MLLWGLIVYHGGRCQGNLTPQCTHLITAALEGVCSLTLKNPFFYSLSETSSDPSDVYTKFVYLLEEVVKCNPCITPTFLPKYESREWKR